MDMSTNELQTRKANRYQRLMDAGADRADIDALLAVVRSQERAELAKNIRSAYGDHAVAQDIATQLDEWA